LGGRIVVFSDAVKQALNRVMPYGNIVMEIREVWDECVGVVSARHSLPSRYTNRELVVLVDDSHWLSELKLYEKDIIHKLGRLLPHPIDRIVWRLVDRLPEDPATAEHQPQQALEASEELPEEIRQQIEASVKRLEDRELQEAMRRFFFKVFSLQHTRETDTEKNQDMWR